jgi:hypothetical protein
VPVIIIAGRRARRLPRQMAAPLQKPFDVQELLHAVMSGCA